MYVTLRETSPSKNINAKNYFDLKAVYICTVYFLQDVVSAQQAVLQNLINYVADFNTSMLHRVGALEVKFILLRDR
jgi:hypothetical protein